MPCDESGREIKAYILDSAGAKPCSAIKPVIFFEFINLHPLALAGRLQIQRNIPIEERGGASSPRDTSGTSVPARGERQGLEAKAE
jgi:hypothetical protein